jgi:nitroreductase
MDYVDVLKLRRSVRKFALKSVSFQDVSEICLAGTHGPMAGNIFTLKFIIVSDKEKIKLLANAAQQPFIAQAPYIIVVYSKTDQVVRSYGKRGEIFARQQAGAAIENMLLRAVDLELSTCWIGWFDENIIKRVLFLPDWAQVEALLPIGYSLEKPIPKKKMDLKLITRFDSYGDMLDDRKTKSRKKNVFA